MCYNVCTLLCFKDAPKVSQEIISPLQDSGAAALKKRLEPWREIALLVQRLLTWEKPLFPAIITGVTTLLYLWVKLYKTYFHIDDIKVLIVLAITRMKLSCNTTDDVNTFGDVP